MKKIILGIASLLMMNSSAYAGCHLKNGDVVCDGKTIASVWCGINCKAYCKKGYRYGNSNEKYGDKKRAAEAAVNKCKR